MKLTSLPTGALKALSPLLRKTTRARTIRERRRRELAYLSSQPDMDCAVGSANWLIRREIDYGGYAAGVKRSVFSSKEMSKGKKKIIARGHEGGDRMLHHGYAGIYADYLYQFVGYRPITLVEVGILKGTGLAIWCDLFPGGRIIGLDIDLNNFHNNFYYLMANGAFKLNRPELYKFDQLLDNENKLNLITNGNKIDIVIDDGHHSIESITNTWKSFRPLLSEKSVYFIEDNKNVLKECKNQFDGFDSFSENGLTVVSRGFNNLTACG